MISALGIDLGTYNSSAAVAVDPANILMVASQHGMGSQGKNFPSFVKFNKNGSLDCVGDPAKRAMLTDPQLVVWGVKRLAGLSYDAAVERGEIKRFKYPIERGPGDSILIRIGSERFTPSHILEAILRRIKGDAETPRINPALGGPFNKAVISVPAYYKAIRTAPILEAAASAGFSEVDTIAEPTAAAVRYGLNIEKDAVVLAFDLGAGTLDVTVLQIVREGDRLVPGELCTSGHESLGGIDMDDLLRDYVTSKYKLPTSPLEAAVLQDEVERAKIRLSRERETEVDFPGGPDITLTRDELSSALSKLLERCRTPMHIALRDAGLEAKDVDHVILVGGPCFMPCVRKVVRSELEAMGARPEVLAEIDEVERNGFPVNPMECVSQGAALKAAQIVQPVCTSMSEGYGIVLGSRYCGMVKPNSMYPIEGRQSAVFSNPNAKHVSITLVAKIIDADQSKDASVYKFEKVGDFSVSLTPNGKLPEIDCVLNVSKEKNVIVKLIDQHTGRPVVYQNPNLLRANSMDLSEADAGIPAWTTKELESFRAKYEKDKGAWNTTDVQKLSELANKLIETAGGVSHDSLRRGLDSLHESIRKSAEAGPTEAANLANEIREFLDLLRQPEIGLIRQEEFQNRLRELEKIGS